MALAKSDTCGSHRLGRHSNTAAAPTNRAVGPCSKMFVLPWVLRSSVMSQTGLCAAVPVLPCVHSFRMSTEPGGRSSLTPRAAPPPRKGVGGTRALLNPIISHPKSAGETWNMNARVNPHKAFASGRALAAGQAAQAPNRISPHYFHICGWVKTSYQIWVNQHPLTSSLQLLNIYIYI